TAQPGGDHGDQWDRALRFWLPRRDDRRYARGDPGHRPGARPDRKTRTPGLTVRVVFLNHNYPRWPGDYSGAALAVLARALVRRGVSVRVVALGGDDAAERPEQEGIMIRRVRIPSRLGQTVFDQDAFAARLRSPRRWD